NFGGVLLHKMRLIPREQISVICAGIVVSLLPYFFPLDGKPHADWLQFLGRFHPLLVHLPIGLVALFPVLEFMGARRPAMREAAGFVLLIALAACFISIFFGLLLAYGSGENGSTVTYHMRGAIALTLELLFCLSVRRSWLVRDRLHAYYVLLAAVLITLAWTGHEGGSLPPATHFLPPYFPPPLT